MLNRMMSPLLFLVFALGGAGWAFATEIQEPVYSESDYQAFTRDDCMGCHDDEDLEGDSERLQGLSLFVDEAILDGSVHEDLLCTDCHRGAKDFEDYPHNDGNPLELNNAEATFMNRGGALYAPNEELAGRITDLFNRLKT